MGEQDDSPMDWSADTPHTIPQPHIPPSEYVPSSYVLMPQSSPHSNNVLETLLDYGNGQLANASS